eukprot:10074847-Lingulodinium_polyedra.AAC.1
MEPRVVQVQGGFQGFGRDQLEAHGLQGIQVVQRPKAGEEGDPENTCCLVDVALEALLRAPGGGVL